MVVRIRENILVGFIILGHQGRHYMTFFCPLFIFVMILVSYGHLCFVRVSSGSTNLGGSKICEVFKSNWVIRIGIYDTFSLFFIHMRLNINGSFKR